MAAATSEFSSAMRHFARTMEAAADQWRRMLDAQVRELGRGWEYPDMLLEDEELEALDMRAFGRTLAEIDDLPVR